MVKGNQITQLYRHYDTNGRLLYVGISLNVLNRTAAHESNTPWFLEVVRIEIDHYPSRDEASRAERAAIRREHPKYNTVDQLKAVMPRIKYTLDVPPMPIKDVAEKVASSPEAIATKRGAFTINSWCAHHDLSRAFFYVLKNRGEGPETYKVGRITRIGREADDAWKKTRGYDMAGRS